MRKARMPSRTVPRRSRADLVAEIYDAMLDPGAGAALATSSAAPSPVRRRSAYISHGAAVSDFIHHNIPGEAVARYGAYYHAVDPLFAMNRRNISGRAEGIFSYALLPEHEFAETEFYRDFGRGVATFHMLGCGLPIDAERTFSIAAHRPADARRFEGQEKRRFDALLPHLQRALQLRGRLDQADRDAAGLAALDALAFGAVICDADGRVRFANPAAEQMAQSGNGLVLRDVDGVMSAVQRQEHLELARLVADAAQGGAGGGMAVTDEAGGILFVLVAPLPRRFIDQPRLVLVTLRPATARPTVSEGTLGPALRADAGGGKARPRSASPGSPSPSSPRATGHRQHVADATGKVATQDGYRQPAWLDSPPRPAASPALTHRPVGAQSRFGEKSLTSIFRLTHGSGGRLARHKEKMTAGDGHLPRRNCGLPLPSRRAPGRDRQRHVKAKRRRQRAEAEGARDRAARQILVASFCSPVEMRAGRTSLGRRSDSVSPMRPGDGEQR